MRPTLRRERDARRRSGDDEPRTAVSGVDECVEPSADEGVVHGADREQRLLGQIPRQTKLPQQQEQVQMLTLI